ncbi:hypothetical protein QR680_017842 [Steinernema hermaphroditum]|uniref:Katanin p80 subunit C-terminal domain-containing protein n=1 Tax=Steinernema hermaphroditum TaxID=289476 RepID=A0AA39HI32_9BILA|nr:hypothetical protein QR680_017842 [Steinernema hermaphroditum]
MVPQRATCANECRWGDRRRRPIWIAEFSAVNSWELEPFELHLNGCKSMNIIYEYPLGDQPNVGVLAPLTKSALLGLPLCQYSYDINSPVPDGVSTFRNLAVGPQPVTCCAVSNDQSAFAYATNVMTIIDSHSGREKRSNLIHDGAVRGVCQYNKNPYCWMSTSDDRNLRSWDTRDYPGDVKFPTKPSMTRCVCMSPDDNVVAVGGDTIIMYDVRTRRVLNELAPNSPVVEMCVHIGEALLAVGCEDRVVSFWDMDTLECVSQSSACDSAIRRLQFIDCRHSAALKAAGRPYPFLLLAATDTRISTFGYEPFEICSFVSTSANPEHFVTLDMRVDRTASSPIITTLGYSDEPTAWSVKQIELETLLSASQFAVSPSSVEASIADDFESLSSPLDTDELESPVDEEMVLKPPEDSFSVVLVPISQPSSPAHRASRTNTNPKPPIGRPLSRPRSAAAVSSAALSQPVRPTMTNRGRVPTHGADARFNRKADVKARASASLVAERPPLPGAPNPLLASRSRTTSKSSSALPRSHSKTNTRRSSVHPPTQRRASRSPSGPATAASIIMNARSGHEQVTSNLDRRLKQINALLRTLQARGINETLAEAIDTGDTALLSEVIRKINGKPKLWTISLCSRIASHLRKVLSDRNELYVDAGLEALQTIVSSFGDLLRQAASTNPNEIGVNMAAEERQARCIKCIEALREIRMNQPFLERRMSPDRRLKFNALMEIFDNKIETLK